MVGWKGALLSGMFSLLLAYSSPEANSQVRFTPNKIMLGAIKDRLYVTDPMTFDTSIGWSFLEYRPLNAYIMTSTSFGTDRRPSLEMGIAYQYDTRAASFYWSAGYIAELDTKTATEKMLKKQYDEATKQAREQGYPIKKFEDVFRRNPPFGKLNGFAIGFGLVISI